MGSEACALDIEAAYRTVPVRPEHKRVMVVMHHNVFWVEHCVTFGLRSAHGLQGEIADCALDIWRSKGVGPFNKWVDDINGFRFPSENGSFPSPHSSFLFDYDRASALKLIEHLNIPWHTSKGHDFQPIFDFIGFIWDLATRSVTLSDGKRLKCKGRVDSALAMFTSSRMSLNDVQRLHGSLSHITFVYVNMRSFLPPISQFAASFSSNPFGTRFPPPSFTSALRSWSEVLSGPTPPRILTPKGPVIDVDLWVDASTDWGVGLILGEKFAAFKLLPGWRGPSRDIGWLETLAVELAAILLGILGYQGQRILLRSDNQGVIGAHEKGRSRNFESNLSLRRTLFCCLDSDLSLALEYVESALNLADPISRGILPEASKAWDYVLPLPDELKQYLIQVVH